MLLSLVFFVKLLAYTLAISGFGLSSPTPKVTHTKEIDKRFELPRLTMTQVYSKTYWGFIEFEETDVDEGTIADAAAQGYEQIKVNFPGEEVIVAALYVPGIGIGVASKPRGNSAQDLFKLANDYCPKWTVVVEGRDIMTPSPGKDPNERVEVLLHAEDLAILKMAQTMIAKKRDARYPQKKIQPNQSFPKGSHLVAWGRYGSRDRNAGLREPCKGGTDQSLTIPCTTVLDKFRITYTTT